MTLVYTGCMYFPTGPTGNSTRTLPVNGSSDSTANVATGSGSNYTDDEINVSITSFTVASIL